MADRFILYDYAHSWSEAVLTVRTVTDIACHQWLRWTAQPPDLHLRTTVDRGLPRIMKPDYCFVEYEDIEQNEAGDTYIHTHGQDGLPVIGAGTSFGRL